MQTIVTQEPDLAQAQVHVYGKCVDYIQASFSGISHEDALFICESCDLPPNDPVEDHLLEVGEIVAMRLSDLIEYNTSTTVTRNEDETLMFDTYIPDPFLYKRKAHVDTVTKYYTVTTARADFKCGICQDDDATTTTVCINHCCHHYHKECLDKWLTTAKLTCPLCNARLEESADEDEI